jgi:tRNA nucleotidyltransferase (CCA-adding enzyme)
MRLKLKKELEKAGGVMIGEMSRRRRCLCVSGRRADGGGQSTLSVDYPKPGKPVYKAAPIPGRPASAGLYGERDGASLNEGSYGLLMDPLNGVADIENRELRLVSNYGFIEDPVRMIRAARFGARLGWQMEEKTGSGTRTGRPRIHSAMSAFQRGYEAGRDCARGRSAAGDEAPGGTRAG